MEIEKNIAPPAPKAKRKGNASWRPAMLLDVKPKDPTVRLRWVSDEPANMMRKRAEGWSNADKGDAVHVRPPTVESGSGDASSITQYRGMTLMKMPEEMAKEREAYYATQTSEALKGVKRKLNEELSNATGGAAEATGRIVIE